MAARTHHVFLVPGFFGFSNLGRLRYFVHVDRFLREEFAARGVPARVHVVRSLPTSSLPSRAAAVADAIEVAVGKGSRRGGRSADVVHLVGHSTGGVDARLLLAPGVVLPTRASVEAIAARVDSAVTVATPHHGTPLASFFATRGGQQLLALLSLATTYVLRFGALPLRAWLELAAVLGTSDVASAIRGGGTLFDELSHRLLGDFSVGRRRAVVKLLRHVIEDRSLLLQLTPEGMDVFDATVRDREGVRYGSVVTRANPPGIGSIVRTGIDPAAQAVHAIYQAIHRITAHPSPAAPPPRPAPAQARALARAFGRVPGADANDGIVPTLSQPWGEVVAAVRGDHLDVIGHFGDETAAPGKSAARASAPHFDWISTGSDFTRADFERTWSRVVDFLVGGTPATSAVAKPKPKPAAAKSKREPHRASGRCR